jgi:hypothetical protein
MQWQYGSPRAREGRLRPVTRPPCQQTVSERAPSGERTSERSEREVGGQAVPNGPAPPPAGALARTYSHSIVPGGFDVMSNVTRFTAAISLIIRDATRSSRSYGNRAQSAVIASSDVTARITTT